MSKRLTGLLTATIVLLTEDDLDSVVMSRHEDRYNSKVNDYVIRHAGV